MGDEAVATARRAFEAFNSGDGAVLSQIFAEDLVLHIPAGFPSGGTHRGLPAFFVAMAPYAELSGGTLKTELESVLAGESHLMAFFRATAQRAGRRGEVVFAQAVKLGVDGRWKEIWLLPNDKTGWAELWA